MLCAKDKLMKKIKLNTSILIPLIFGLIYSCSSLNLDTFRTPASTDLGINCHDAISGLYSSAKKYDDQVVGAHTVRLKSEDGKIIERDGSNFFLRDNGSARSYVEDFVEAYFSRGVDEISVLNQRMTDVHANNEMTFMTKDPVTGNYTKVSRVPFRGFVPMPKNSYERLTNSTEAFMKIFREVLQNVYSKEHTPSNLTIDKIDSDSQKVFLDVLKSSIYYEPVLNNPVLKDYPFSPVIGFDFAIKDIENIDKPISYEANGSTPSGLTNNMLLRHAMKTADFDLLKTASKKMLQGNAPKALRETIESNALQWTGQRDGITVVIGPGSGNAAHPDVSAIAEFSGMPLVKPEDLYIDKNGFVRLNIGSGKNDPKVTGVYSRVDESFLLQSSKKNIPIRDPDFYKETNRRISQKTGLKLKPHVGYNYRYNSNGEVIGVHVDESGEPKLLETDYKIGKDPNRPLEEQEDELVDALLNKKIYISNVGGRTLDDKRIFQIIADFLASKYLKEGQKGVGPTRTLLISELDELYSTPVSDLGNYVIKEPDGSGGKGVYILSDISEEERIEIVEKVKSNPGYYTVQEFADQSLVTTTNKNESGELQFETTVMDLRYFAMLNGEDELVADPDAFLVRVASPLSASTNTSKGAGYGMLFIVDPKNKTIKQLDEADSVLPDLPSVEMIGANRQVQLDMFARQLSYLINATKPKNIGNLSKYALESMVFLHRDSMDLLGLNYSPYIQRYREYIDGKISSHELHQSLVEMKNKIENGLNLSADVTKILKRSLRKNIENGSIEYNFLDIESLSKNITLKKLNRRAHKIRMDHIVDGFSQRETFEILDSTDEHVSKMVKEVRDLGGEVRHTQIFDSKDNVINSLYGQNYFRFDSNNFPILGVNMASANALPALAHEFQHFFDWREVYESYLKKGYSKARARKAAKKDVLKTSHVYTSESRAVKSELQAEESITSVFNRVKDDFPGQRTSPQYISRVLYPNVEALKKKLIESGGEITPEIRGWVGKTISTAQKEKLDMFKRLESALKNSKEDSVASFEIKQKLTYLQKTSLFELIIHEGAYANFTKLGFDEQIKKLFESVMNEDDQFYFRVNSIWQSPSQIQQ